MCDTYVTSETLPRPNPQTLPAPLSRRRRRAREEALGLVRRDAQRLVRGEAVEPELGRGPGAHKRIKYIVYKNTIIYEAYNTPGLLVYYVLYVLNIIHVLIRIMYLSTLEQIDR